MNWCGVFVQPILPLRKHSTYQLCVSMIIRTWHHTSTHLTSQKALYIPIVCVHEHTHLASHMPLLHHHLFIYYLLSLIPGYPPPRTAGLRPTLRPRLRLRPWCAGGKKSRSGCTARRTAPVNYASCTGAALDMYTGYSLGMH